jgi:hypothetical protein
MIPRAVSLTIRRVIQVRMIWVWGVVWFLGISACRVRGWVERRVIHIVRAIRVMHWTRIGVVIVLTIQRAWVEVVRDVRVVQVVRAVFMTLIPTFFQIAVSTPVRLGVLGVGKARGR